MDATVRIGFDSSAVTSGVNRAGASIRTFGKNVRTSLRSAFAPQNLLGALGVSAGMAGMKSLIDKFDRIGDLAKQTGASAEAIQRVGLMAKLSGSDVESVAKALNRVNRELAKGEGVDTFRKLGIDIKKFFATDADGQILMLADAFQRAQKSGKGLSEAYDLFGKSAAELLPLLQENRAELEKIGKTEVISQAEIDKIQALNDAFDELKEKAATFMMKTAVETETGVSNFIEWYKATLRKWNDGDLDAVDKELARQGMAAGDAAHKPRADRKAREAGAGVKADAAIAAALEKDTSAKVAKNKDAARGFALAELQILEAEAGKHTAKLARLDRELRMEKYKLEYKKQLNATEAQAEQMAKRRVNAEDAIKSGRRKIQGYTQDRNTPRGSALDSMYGISDREPIGKRLYKPGASPGLDNLRRLQMTDDRGNRLSAFPSRSKSKGSDSDKAAQKTLQSIEDYARETAENTAPIRKG
jgi:hypothetical protein